MPRSRRPGPKTPWQDRIRYNRSRCEARLKPSQIENLTAADAFAAYLRKPLNGFLTIKFSESEQALLEFRAGTKRLSQWHRRWGGELCWLYVWEAIGGYHVHALVHVPRRMWREFEKSAQKAFAEQDLLLKHRSAGPAAMAYLCKGTDLQTHWKLRGWSRVKAKVQGSIAWKRCGCSENIGPKARKQAGFASKMKLRNCAETYTLQSHASGHSQQSTNVGTRDADNAPSLVVSKISHAPFST